MRLKDGAHGRCWTGRCIIKRESAVISEERTRRRCGGQGAARLGTGPGTYLSLCVASLCPGTLHKDALHMKYLQMDNLLRDS